MSEIENVCSAKGLSCKSGYISYSMDRNIDLVEIKGKRIKKGKQVNIYTSKK